MRREQPGFEKYLTAEEALEFGAQLESCDSCGGELGPSPSFVWHYPEEDCRAIRLPFKNAEEVKMCGRSRA